MGYDRTNVSRLHYADDTLFLLDGDLKNVRIHKLPTRCFELIFGLNINWKKTHILSISLSDSVCLQMALSLGCTLKEWPSDYLGLPLGGLPTHKEF